MLASNRINQFRTNINRGFKVIGECTRSPIIELIRLLVDSFAKVVQFASTNKERRDLIQLGGRLYNVYIQLADILVLAGQRSQESRGTISFRPNLACLAL
jgi:hypothetical protein